MASRFGELCAIKIRAQPPVLPHTLPTYLVGLILTSSLRNRVCRAVEEFLVEAVVSVARRPQEVFEAVLGASEGAGFPQTPEGFSLLGAAALRQVVRVLGSAKIGAAQKAAIAGYVSGNLRRRFGLNPAFQQLCLAPHDLLPAVQSGSRHAGIVLLIWRLQVLEVVKYRALALELLLCPLPQAITCRIL